MNSRAARDQASPHPNPVLPTWTWLLRPSDPHTGFDPSPLLWHEFGMLGAHLDERCEPCDSLRSSQIRCREPMTLS